MKKLSLLFALGAISFASHAQLATETSVLSTNHKATFSAGAESVAPTVSHKVSPAPVENTANKTTVGGTRWYNHALTQREIFNLTTSLSEAEFYDSLHSALYYIWEDSSVTYSDATPITFASFGQVFHPQSTVFNDPFVPSNAGKLTVTGANAYRVDSIKVRGIYGRSYNTYVDTMILTFVTETAGGRYAFSSYGGDVYTNHGIDSFATQLWALTDAPNGGTPVTQVAYSVGGGAAMSEVTINVPLTNAVYADSLPDGTHEIKAAVGINVPAGRMISVSATFKSGRPAVTSTLLEDYNYFAYLSHETTPNGYVYYDGSDFNMSSLVNLRNVDTVNPTLAIYIPTIAYTAPLKGEMHNISWKITCSTCETVGVKDIEKSFSSNVYPNPAANTVTIPVTTTKAGTMSVTILNTVGQVVANQNFGQISAGTTKEAKFDVSALPAGIYIYTVNVGGETVSERFTVAH